MLNKVFLLSIFISFTLISLSQTIEFPVWTVKSHENLDIEKIERENDVTIIHLIVMSEMDIGAWFCADKNIYLKSEENNFQTSIIKSVNIPTCPEKHNFKAKGEVLRFSLYFPPIPENITRINLIENCENACFFFNDIVLDPNLNREIRKFENSVDDYGKGNIQLALEGFESIVNTCKDLSSYRYSHSLSILPVIYEDINQITNAENAYRKILISDLDDRFPTGRKGEYYSNFKHKAAIRLSVLLGKKGNLIEALKFLNQAENKYILQHTDLEEDFRNKDHFIIVDQKISLLGKQTNIHELLTMSFIESFSSDYGEMPYKTSKNISEIITSKIGKAEFIKSYKSAVKSLVLDEKGETTITFNLEDYDYKITSEKPITKSEAKKRLLNLDFYVILKTD